MKHTFLHSSKDNTTVQHKNFQEVLPFNKVAAVVLFGAMHDSGEINNEPWIAQSNQTPLANAVVTKNRWVFFSYARAVLLILHGNGLPGRFLGPIFPIQTRKQLSCSTFSCKTITDRC